ncbi:MAG: OmpA family protein [Acidobacteria bacterium]|nr:OmpA family protein [Acidobacteriota bacterium]NIM60229.1 OmpA family protein [Acidobacteriota bacterium]NIO60267.1 OmpA family protein [Acidobacteriota bacterium]NIQ31322.1 OmpA family protein [Acidobacteriota bacterium]NIQ86545.1 OmpA family protein [Acidobacteriota bacterium]
MHYRKLAILLSLIVIVPFISTGCVSKKVFRANVDENAARMDSAETGIEANERRIGDLKGETDSKIAALEGRTDEAVQIGKAADAKAAKAQDAADRAARGRLLWSVTLSDERVKFSFNQADLPDEAKSTLDELCEKIKSYGKAVYVEIEGHTDSTGTDDYNYTLGLRRAGTVRDYMHSAGGIPLHAINTISLGESVPVADNGNSDGRAQNRRVVVRVLE